MKKYKVIYVTPDMNGLKTAVLDIADAQEGVLTPNHIRLSLLANSPSGELLTIGKQLNISIEEAED